MAGKKLTKKKTDFTPDAFRLGVNFSIKNMGSMPMADGGDSEEEVIKITGYASFSGDCNDDTSCFIDRTNDIVVPSGIDITNYKKSPVILFQHDRDYVIGKSLTITKKPDGLYVEADIHAGAMEEEDYYAIKNGLYTSLSIGFRTKAGEYKPIGDADVFFITKSELLEISVVSIPCNTNSTFSVVKSYEGNIYAGTQTYSPKNTPAEVVTNKTLGEDAVKLKMRDLLPEAEVKKLDELGMGASLDELQEVDTKSFIEALVSKSVAAEVAKSIELIKAELTKSAETTTEESTEEALPTTEEETTAEVTATPEELAAAEVAAEEEKAAAVERTKNYADFQAALKTLVEEK